MVFDSPRVTKGRRVLFVASLYTHLAAFHIPFMKLLMDKGYEVHAAASSADGLKEDVKNIGVTCWEVPFCRSPYALGNIWAYLQLKGLLKKYHFDLIHVHTPVAAFLGRLLSNLTNQGGTIYTAHGFHFYDGAPIRNWLIYYTAERIAVSWTDGLIVMNQEDFDNAQRLGFMPGKNLFCVHGVGVDLDKISASTKRNTMRRVLGISANDLVVTCVAELIKRKNHIFLLQAWKIFSAHCNQAHLLLVGDGKEKRTLENWIKQQRLPRVYLLGYCKNVPEILNDTDILTLVSKHEGLPRAIMEAMAASKPIVATNVRGNRDLVENGRTGLLVELGDVHGLSAALEQLSINPTLRIKMGIAGQKKIKEYSLDNVLREMDDIYTRYLSLTGSKRVVKK